MPDIHVARPFILTLEDREKTRIPFTKGVHTVEQEIADHWYVQANLVGAKPNPAAGTPAFVRAAAEERARADAEHAKIEAETNDRIVAHVRGKMEEEYRERMKIAVAEHAEVSAKDRDAELEKRVGEIEARLQGDFDKRVKDAVDAALLAHMEAEEAKSADDKGGKSKGAK